MIDDGGPAFPTTGPETSGNGTGAQPGMSVRDFIMAHVLSGMGYQHASAGTIVQNSEAIVDYYMKRRS